MRWSERCTKFAIIILIVIIAFTLNLWLVTQDNRPPPWDYATYLSRSLEFYYAVRTGVFSSFFSVFNDPYRSPLVPLAALPFYALFGVSYSSAMIANLLFIGILIVFTFKLGEKIQSSKIGLIAAVILITVPSVLTYDRYFNLDFPEAALSVAGIYFMVASQGFTKRSNSIAAGAIFGMGLLTKWSYAVFVAPVFIAELIQYRRRIGIAHLIESLAVCAAVSLTWYANAITQGLIQNLLHYAYGPAAKPYSAGSNLLDMQSLLFYPRTIYNYGIGPLYGIALFGVAIVGVIISWFQRETERHGVGFEKRKDERSGGFSRLDRRILRSLLFSFLIALLVFTFLEDKNVRFLVPFLPPLVLLLVSAGCSLHVRFGPLLLIGIAATGSAVSIAGALQPALGKQLGIYESYTLSNEYLDYNDYSPPKAFDWRVEPILKLIGTLDPNARVGILTSHWVFNQDTFRYNALRLGFTDLSFYDYRDTQLQGRDGYSMLKDFDFVLKKTGDLGEPWNTFTAKEVVQRLGNQSDPFYSSWRNISTFNLPDGSQVIVFMRTSYGS